MRGQENQTAVSRLVLPAAMQKDVTKMLHSLAHHAA